MEDWKATDQEKLYNLFKLTDERTQFEVVRMLEEHRRSFDKPTLEELEADNKNLRDQVKSWHELFASEQRLHLADNEYRDRVIAEQQKQIEKLEKKIRK